MDPDKKKLQKFANLQKKLLPHNRTVLLISKHLLLSFLFLPPSAYIEGVYKHIYIYIYSSSLVGSARCRNDMEEVLCRCRKIKKKLCFKVEAMWCQVREKKSRKSLEKGGDAGGTNVKSATTPECKLIGEARIRGRGSHDPSQSRGSLRSTSGALHHTQCAYRFVGNDWGGLHAEATAGL